MLTGKKIVLGVSGGIAAYKMANVASALVKLHADVHVIMTENATHFITPETFETLTANRCYTDTFDRSLAIHVPHVTLGSTADAILIAPATADVLGKIAHGIADDMLSTTIMATKAPVILAPAMNNGMYENKIVQSNIKKLKQYGYYFIEPSVGHLACGYDAKGKLPKTEEIIEYVETLVKEKN